MSFGQAVAIFDQLPIAMAAASDGSYWPEFPFKTVLGMRHKELASYRRRIVPLARGTVLEVGVGSGLNLPFYGDHVERLITLDPSRQLLKRVRLSSASRPVHLLQASAEAIPCRTNAIDTVIMTWVLCSVSDPLRALGEVHRVLKPQGELLFVEHGLAPEPRVKLWQDRLDPIWARISCHLNRRIDLLLADAGFEVTQLDAGYLPTGPKLLTFFYEGRARPV